MTNNEAEEGQETPPCSRCGFDGVAVACVWAGEEGCQLPAKQGQERPQQPKYHGEDLAAYYRQWERYALALEQRIRQLEKQLEALTPGGSEFVNNPTRCVEFIRERMAVGQQGAVKAVIERDAALEQVKELKAWCGSATGFIDAMRDHFRYESAALYEQAHRILLDYAALLKADSLSKGEK